MECQDEGGGGCISLLAQPTFGNLSLWLPTPPASPQLPTVCVSPLYTYGRPSSHPGSTRDRPSSAYFCISHDQICTLTICWLTHTQQWQLNAASQRKAPRILACAEEGKGAIFHVVFKALEAYQRRNKQSSIKMGLVGGGRLCG